MPFPPLFLLNVYQFYACVLKKIYRFILWNKEKTVYLPVFILFFINSI